MTQTPDLSAPLSLTSLAQDLADIVAFTPGLTIQAPQSSPFTSHPLSSHVLRTFQEITDLTYTRPIAILPLRATLLSSEGQEHLYLSTCLTTSGRVVNIFAHTQSATPNQSLHRADMMDLVPNSTPATYPSIPPIPASWLDTEMTQEAICDAAPSKPELLQAIMKVKAALTLLPAQGQPSHSLGPQ